jgi:hypothetical protein
MAYPKKIDGDKIVAAAVELLERRARNLNHKGIPLGLDL